MTMTLRFSPYAALAGILFSGWLLAQTATRPMAAAHAAVAVNTTTTAAAPANATPTTTTTTTTTITGLPTGEESDSLLQGNLLYDHLGEADPFYPTRLDCTNIKYRATHLRQCPDGGPAKTGCAKFKLEELQLTGVTNTLGISVAMLSAENKPYFVKVGDQCGDAKVLEIDAKTSCVKWRQDIPQDQNSLRPYKDVYRCLRGLPPDLAARPGK